MPWSNRQTLVKILNAGTIMREKDSRVFPKFLLSLLLFCLHLMKVFVVKWPLSLWGMPPFAFCMATQRRLSSMRAMSGFRKRSALGDHMIRSHGSGNSRSVTKRHTTVYFGMHAFVMAVPVSYSSITESPKKWQLGNDPYWPVLWGFLWENQLTANFIGFQGKWDV